MPSGMLTMTTRFHYRKATPGDEEALAALSGELGYPTSTEQVAGRLSHLLADRDHFILIAADGENHPVGWVHAFVARRIESNAFAELGGMVVSEEHRGTGIGTALLRKAEQWAGSQQLQSLRVRSNVLRERAHGFYERAGYRLTKTSHVFQKPL